MFEDINISDENESIIKETVLDEVKRMNKMKLIDYLIKDDPEIPKSIRLKNASQFLPRNLENSEHMNKFLFEEEELGEEFAAEYAMLHIFAKKIPEKVPQWFLEMLKRRKLHSIAGIFAVGSSETVKVFLNRSDWLDFIGENYF